MSEELGLKLQGMFRSIYDAADKSYMRPIKRNMFKCGLNCLDDKNSVKQAEECIEDCGQVMHVAMSTLQTEVNAFQGRVDRCLMNCQDDVRNEKEDQIAKRLFDTCAEKCVENIGPSLPGVIKGICDKLDKIKKEHKVQ